MEAKEKILKRFEELIDQTEEIKKGKRDSLAYDLWKKRVESLLEKVGGEKLLRRYRDCFPSIGICSLPESSYHEEFLDTAGKVKNLLIAAKESIELFEDEEVKKETKKLKRHFEIEGGIPGILKGKFGGKEY